MSSSRSAVVTPSTGGAIEAAARRHHQNRAGPQQCLTITWVDAQFGGQVDAAEGAAHHTGGGADRCCAKNSRRSLNERQHRQSAAQIGDSAQFGGVFGLGHHGRRPGFGDQLEIRVIPRGVATIDPHHGGVTGAQPDAQMFTSVVFLRRSNGVLEVDDDHVGAGGRRLVEAVRAVTGHEQERPGRAEEMVAGHAYRAVAVT